MGSDGLAKRDSMFETIAKTTAKTVSEVRKAYHETETIHEQTDDTENGTDHDTKRGFFPFGTPFQNIVKFTSEVEVFTRHIDTFTRDRFQKGARESPEDRKGDERK